MTDTEDRPPEATASAGARPASNGLLALATTFALVLAMLATTIAGFLWWQYREFYVALDGADEQAAQTLETARASIARVDERIDALNATFEANRARTTALADRVDALPGRLSALEQRIAAVQGGSLGARTAWLYAEAEYHLSLANTELALAGRWENSIAALERADRALLELGNPALGPVREAIAAELLALRAVSLPDIEGLAFSLGRLEERVAELPLRSAAQGGAAREHDPLEDAEPGLGRLWLSFKQALASLVRVERRDEPVARLLSIEEARLVRKQLELELKLARMAALGTESQAFHASLGAALELLQREFDTAAAEIEGARVLLEQMRTLDIAPAKPDISRSLNLLRAIPAGGV
jgi:uncharacterized protein HemX